MKYKAFVYARNITYNGDFTDNDEVDLFISGRDLGHDEVVETHIIDERDVIDYENRREVRDLGNGVCTVYWCEVEQEEPTEEERMYEAECEYYDRLAERQREND